MDTNEREVTGTVALTFDYQADAQSPRDSVYLNGIKMHYRLASLNGEKAEYRSDDKGIWFTPSKGVLKARDNTLVIHYSCKPIRGIFFIGWQDPTNLSKRQIWTQGQGIDHRHWIPYKDDQTDKLTTEMIISFDSTYQVISNGKLIMKSPNNYKKGEMIWHYRMKDPQPGYLMMIGIGKYASKNTFSQSGVPLTQYYYPDREDVYAWTYYKNEEIFNFLQREIGVPYPWQNYKQVPVQDFQHGAMENTSATIFGDFFVVDEIGFNDRNYTYVNAHELAHQWFGNLITAESSDHHWLHEGFATYYQWLSEKHLYGQDFFDWERYKAAQMVFEASTIDTIQLASGKAGSSRFYQKGAWVLYMLDQQLGHETYRKVIKYYLKENEFGVVNTQTFQDVIKEVSGKDYSKFINHWVFTAGEASIVAELKAVNDTSFNIEIAKDSGTCFCGDFTVKVIYEDSVASIKSSWPMPLQVYSSEVVPTMVMNFKIPVSQDTSSSILYWTIESNMGVLARIKEVKPLMMWKAQYQKAEGMLDRYFAVKALQDFDLREKEDLLTGIVLDEQEFFSIRGEALKQLISDDHHKAERYLIKALMDDDVQLQKEAIRLVDEVKGDLELILPQLRSGQSYELRKMAIHKSVNPSKPEANQWLMDSAVYKEPGLPGNKVLITTLLYRTAFFKDREALLELREFTSSGYDFNTRTEAMDALRALKYYDKDLNAYYFDAALNLNRTLGREARAHLKFYYGDDKHKAEIDEYINKHVKEFSHFQKRLVNRTFGLNLE